MFPPACPNDAAAVAPRADYWRSVRFGFNRCDESRVGFRSNFFGSDCLPASASLMIRRSG
ncbi:hypothetical protein KCP76_01755 [Salmonella enterica subsp. enterica serovar Weltevreden]|nr:hypothetical protein KCP76_01755 [Salmonella enterica subsp. enterica serovar Weltevreden]